MRSRFFWFTALLLWLPALAHPVDEFSLNVQLEGLQARCLWRLPCALVHFIDEDQDRVLSSEEIARRGPELLRRMDGKVAVRSNGQPGRLSLEVDPRPDRNPTHCTLYLLATWDAPVGDLSFHYDFFPDSPGTRGLIVVHHQGAPPQSGVVAPGQPEYQPGASWQRRAQAFFFTGTEHIFCGYDHILFLLVLLIPATSIWQVLKTVTAFTVAHSITLSLSVLGLVSLPARPVEATIALSIALAALLNLRKGDDHRRWPIAFVFGLVHGLGFASILRDQGVTGSNAVLPLVSFNLGVEAGQVLIVLVAFPLMVRLCSQERTMKILSVASAAMASLWFFERVTG